MIEPLSSKDVAELLRSTENDVVCPCLDLRKAALAEIDRLRAALKDAVTDIEEAYHEQPELPQGLDARVSYYQSLFAGAADETAAGHPPATDIGPGPHFGQPAVCVCNMDDCLVCFPENGTAEQL